MTSKLIGILLLLSGIIGFIVLLIINKVPASSERHSDIRRFKLDHEYKNKGFTEKGQSEGTTDVPKADDTTSLTAFESDPYFSPSSDNQSDTPGDNF